MGGLEFTKEAAKRLEKTYLTRDVVAQRLETIRQLNLSVVRAFWISDVVRAICAKAWPKSLGIMVLSSASIFRPISLRSAIGEKLQRGFHTPSATRPT